MQEKNPFNVPENYFQNFKLEIMQKLPEKSSKSKILNFRGSVLGWSAVAATVAIFIVTGVGYMVNNQNEIFKSDVTTTFADQNITDVDQQYTSLQDDYYLFLEDQTTLSLYNDELYSDDF